MKMKKNTKIYLKVVSMWVLPSFLYKSININ